jgi:hypothetical protein
MVNAAVILYRLSSLYYAKNIPTVFMQYFLAGGLLGLEQKTASKGDPQKSMGLQTGIYYRHGFAAGSV